jgi:tRNA pseudouridine55 synthase
MSTRCCGLLVINKPGGMTSRAVVNRAQAWFPRGTKLGHTGTLDPLATGVLVLCVGPATRLAEYVQRMDKIYRTDVRLGAWSDTDDAEGQITAVMVEQPPSEEKVRAVLAGFIGDIVQVPPDYSAAKVAGRRAYDLARQGAELDLSPRKVRVHDIELLGYGYPGLCLQIRCGKGTYIRSLARDLGERLNCGAYVETLRRLCVGPFLAEEGLSLDAGAEKARQSLVPIAKAVASLPSVTLGGEEMSYLRRGQPITVKGSTLTIATGEVAVFDTAGALAAIVEADRAKGVLKPTKVFNTG